VEGGTVEAAITGKKDRPGTNFGAKKEGLGIRSVFGQSGTSSQSVATNQSWLSKFTENNSSCACWGAAPEENYTHKFFICKQAQENWQSGAPAEIFSFTNASSASKHKKLGNWELQLAWK